MRLHGDRVTAVKPRRVAQSVITGAFHGALRRPRWIRVAAAVAAFDGDARLMPEHMVMGARQGHPHGLPAFQRGRSRTMPANSAQGDKTPGPHPPIMVAASKVVTPPTTTIDSRSAAQIVLGKGRLGDGGAQAVTDARQKAAVEEVAGDAGDVVDAAFAEGDVGGVDDVEVAGAGGPIDGFSLVTPPEIQGVHGPQIREAVGRGVVAPGGDASGRHPVAGLATGNDGLGGVEGEAGSGDGRGPVGRR